MAIGLLTLAASGCGRGTSGTGSGKTGSHAGSAAGATEAVMSVTGSAPHGASINYGNDSNTYTSGRVPFHTKLGLDTRAGFYVLFVQLKNGGNVTCTLTIGNATSVGHARGGHKSCLAKLTDRYNGTWYPSK